MDAAADCTLRFVRGSQYADSIRSYKILVNGKQVGKLARNSKLEVHVPRGPVTVKAKIDWASSQPLTIEATPEGAIEIEVSNNWGAVMGIWAITFGARNYLALKRLPAV